MRTLYIDCSMGAAGDMLTAAALELLPDPGAFIDKMNSIGIPGVHIEAVPMTKCGISGTHMRVTVYGHEETEHHHGHGENRHAHSGHHHSTMHGIGDAVSTLDIPEEVKQDVLAVYRLIADAESRVHGRSVEQIHFHEVGALDAVADITAFCLLMRMLRIERVVASPVHVGSGTVCCAHGVLPVPAPATAQLLLGCPVYGGEIEGELCTPTGAALLKYFADAFGPMPAMVPEGVGYGMGSRDYPRANCLRLVLGQSEDVCPAETALELSCNVDDMSAESIAFAMDRLFEAGAKEVYTVPAGMKKSRPGTLLRVICLPEQRGRILQTLFRHTSTIGVRETETRRYVLDRTAGRVRTPLGDIRYKSSSGYGVERFKYEYDDCAGIARTNDLTLDEVRRLADRVRRTEVHSV